MVINPAVRNILVGAGAATVTGLWATKAIDGVMEKHPTGSAGDGKAAMIGGLTAVAGVAIAVGSMLMLGSRSPALAEAGLATGAGIAIGGIGALVVGGIRHGSGVDSITDGVIDRYDNNWDKKLDLEGNWWRHPENYRVERTRHEDPDGDVHYDTTYYEILEFTRRANTNDDRYVERPEARVLVKSYDQDGDDRLKGNEMRKYEREVGERRVWNPWELPHGL